MTDSESLVSWRCRGVGWALMGSITRCISSHGSGTEVAANASKAAHISAMATASKSAS
jgi:hypothetical protein